MKQKTDNTFNDFIGVLYSMIYHYIKEEENKNALIVIYRFLDLIPLKLLIDNKEDSKTILILQNIIIDNLTNNQT